jgi:serine/threonine protein kinase
MDDNTIKLIDFGFTRSYQDSDYLETYCGSSAYAAPGYPRLTSEILVGQKYTGPEADIWSLGVVLYTMVCGFLPFDGENEEGTHHQIKNIQYEVPEFLHPSIRIFNSRYS